MFSYEEKVIIKYLQIKYKHGATRVVNDHTGYEWNVNDLKELLKDAIDNARKEVSGQPKSAHTEENIELVEEIIIRKED